MTEVKQKGGQQQGRSFGRTLQHGLVMGLALMSSVEAAFCPPPCTEEEPGGHACLKRLQALLNERLSDHQEASAPSGGAAAAAPPDSTTTEETSQTVVALLNDLQGTWSRFLSHKQVLTITPDELAHIRPLQVVPLITKIKEAPSALRTQRDAWLATIPVLTPAAVRGLNSTALHIWPDEKIMQLSLEDIVHLLGQGGVRAHNIPKAAWPDFTPEDIVHLRRTLGSAHLHHMPEDVWPVMSVEILATWLDIDLDCVPDVAWPAFRPQDIFSFSRRRNALHHVPEECWPKMDAEHLMAMVPHGNFARVPKDCWPDAPLTEEQFVQLSNTRGALTYLPKSLWPVLSVQMILELHYSKKLMIPPHAWPARLSKAELMELAQRSSLVSAPNDGRYERFTVEEIQRLPTLRVLRDVPYSLFPDLTDDAVIAELGGLTPFLEDIRRKQQEAYAEAAAAEPLAKPVRAPKRT